MDTTHRRRAATLAGRVPGLLAAILVVMALPLDFVGKLAVLRSKFCDPGFFNCLVQVQASPQVLGEKSS